MGLVPLKCISSFGGNGILSVLLAFLLKILTIPLYLVFYDTVFLSSQALSFQCCKRWRFHLAKFLLNRRFNHLNEHVYVLLPSMGQKLMVPYQFIPCTVYYLIDTLRTKILRQGKSFLSPFKNGDSLFEFRCIGPMVLDFAPPTNIFCLALSFRMLRSFG